MLRNWMLGGTAAVLLSGCMSFEESCETVQDSDGQEIVCWENGALSYTLQGHHATYTAKKAWTNPETRARANVVIQGPGSARVAVTDASGHQVYSKQHSGSGQAVGDEITSAGKAGGWNLTVEVTALEGQVVVRLRPA